MDQNQKVEPELSPAEKAASLLAEEKLKTMMGKLSKVNVPTDDELSNDVRHLSQRLINKGTEEAQKRDEYEKNQQASQPTTIAPPITDSPKIVHLANHNPINETKSERLSSNFDQTLTNTTAQQPVTTTPTQPQQMANSDDKFSEMVQVMTSDPIESNDEPIDKIESTQSVPFEPVTMSRSNRIAQSNKLRKETIPTGDEPERAVTTVIPPIINQTKVETDYPVEDDYDDDSAEYTDDYEEAELQPIESRKELKKRQKAERLAEKEAAKATKKQTASRRRHHSRLNEQLGLVTITNPKSQAAEQFRTIRTNIQFSGIDKKIKTIVVTSAKSAEGKSTTSANLAVTWANQNVRTLLVDADMRKPTAHRTFQLDNNRGLTTLLTEDMSLDDAIQDSGVPYLSILTSGPVPPNPSELLNAKKMDELLVTLYAAYDFIIFDAPPILGIVDAQILASKIDGTILVVRQNVTNKNDVAEAKQILDKSRAHILGAVLNDVKTKRVEGYNGYYGYGSE